MGRATFDNYPDKFLNIDFPTVLSIKPHVLTRITNKVSGWTIAKIYGAGTISTLAIEAYEA